MKFYLVSLTYDLDPQSQTSYGQGKLPYRKSGQTVRPWDCWHTDRRKDGSDSITSTTDAGSKYASGLRNWHILGCSREYLHPCHLIHVCSTYWRMVNTTAAGYKISTKYLIKTFRVFLASCHVNAKNSLEERSWSQILKQCLHKWHNNRFSLHVFDCRIKQRKFCMVQKLGNSLSAVQKKHWRHSNIHTSSYNAQAPKTNSPVYNVASV